jgi:hypothetical protein
MIIYGRMIIYGGREGCPDGHLCTIPEENWPWGDTDLMAIYGRMAIYERLLLRLLAA